MPQPVIQIEEYGEPEIFKIQILTALYVLKLGLIL